MDHPLCVTTYARCAFLPSTRRWKPARPRCSTPPAAVIGERDAGDGARPRRSADADDRARDGSGLQYEFADFDRIAVTVGPGTFTGLRVGIAAARGIALAAGKPAIGLSTLAALAAPLIAEDDSGAVVAAIDARHDHVYLQVFGPGGRTLVTPRVTPVRDAVRAAVSGAPRIIGSGAELLAKAWPRSQAAEPG